MAPGRKLLLRAVSHRKEILLPRIHDAVHTVGLAVGVVVAALIIIFAFALIAFQRLKVRQYLEARRRDPSLTWTDFRQQCKITIRERMEAEELQRRLMIQKSLACRSSQSSSDTVAAAEETDCVGLRQDLKEWEAGLYRECTNSTVRHPLVATFCEEQPADLPLSCATRLLVEHAPKLPHIPSFGPLARDWPSLMGVGMEPVYLHDNR